MAKGKFPFEKSKKDVEPKGMREGSPQEEAFDRRQMRGPVKVSAFKKGGKVTSNVVSTGNLPAMGAQPTQSAMVGGVGNTPPNATKNYKK